MTFAFFALKGIDITSDGRGRRGGGWSLAKIRRMKQSVNRLREEK